MKKIKFNNMQRQLFFFALCILIFLLCIRYLNISIKTSNINSVKEQHWQAMEKEVDSWGDSLGLGIDPGIKKTVIVLNLLGFKTEQSCEGHMDWGLAYPWVSFMTQDAEIDALQSKWQDIIKRINEKELEIKQENAEGLKEGLREESEELSAMYKETHLINDKIEKLSKLKLVPLNNLIADFYKRHSIEPDKMLALHELNRIYSIGGYWQVVRNNSERLNKLKEYQQEMKLFTDFLTDYHFRT